MAKAFCLGESKEVKSIKELEVFAKAKGLSQIVVYQNGIRVTPNTINFVDDIEIIPHDKFMATTVTFKNISVTVDNVEVVVDDIENKIIIKVPQHDDDTNNNEYRPQLEWK